MDILENLIIVWGYFSVKNVETQTGNPVINRIDKMHNFFIFVFIYN